MSVRLSVSFDERTARRVRQRGAQTRGGASAYLARLVRQDELREAAEAMARWYAARPTAVEDAEAERHAAIDEAGCSMAFRRGEVWAYSPVLPRPGQSLQRLLVSADGLNDSPLPVLIGLQVVDADPENLLAVALDGPWLGRRHDHRTCHAPQAHRTRRHDRSAGAGSRRPGPRCGTRSGLNVQIDDAVQPISTILGMCRRRADAAAAVHGPVSAPGQFDRGGDGSGAPDDDSRLTACG